MSLSQLLSQNVLLRWITGKGASHDLPLSMAGVRLGERCLQVGVADGGLLAAIAGKVGYTGRACGADTDASALERARRAAAREGVLVELDRATSDRLPYDDEAFDVVVVQTAHGSSVSAPEAPLLGECHRVLRTGGRCLVVLSTRGANATTATAGVTRHLQDAGFRAARVLAEREGLAFVEAVRSGA